MKESLFFFFFLKVSHSNFDLNLGNAYFLWEPFFSSCSVFEVKIALKQYFFGGVLNGNRWTVKPGTGFH